MVNCSSPQTPWSSRSVKAEPHKPLNFEMQSSMDQFCTPMPSAIMPPVLQEEELFSVLSLIKKMTYLVPTIKSKKSWILMFPPSFCSICFRTCSSTMPRTPPLNSISRYFVWRQRILTHPTTRLGLPQAAASDKSEQPISIYHGDEVDSCQGQRTSSIVRLQMCVHTENR